MFHSLEGGLRGRGIDVERGGDRARAAAAAAGHQDDGDTHPFTPPSPRSGLITAPIDGGCYLHGREEGPIVCDDLLVERVTGNHQTVLACLAEALLGLLGGVLDLGRPDPQPI